MEIKKIKQLIGILEESDLEELEVTEKDSSVRLVKRKQNSQVLLAPPPAAAATPAATTAKDQPAKEITGHAIRSPMVGTFYSAPSPDSPPFIKVGSQVKEGDVIGIVEAMKTMNKIKSDRAGIVKELSVDNSTPVEFNQILCILQ